MLSKEQIDFFQTNGFLCIPNVLSTEIVTELRSKILYIFESDEWKKESYNTEQVLCNVYQTFPEFMRYTLTQTVIESIRSLLNSTPVLIPETAIHHKFYTGWHKDSTSIEKAGEIFHQEEDALFLQCGFYLQDNNDLGGGLTVMKKSHTTADNFVDPHSYTLSIKDRIKLKLGTYTDQNNTRINPNQHEIYDIPSKAGDFVIFNFKLNHKATFPKNGKTESVPFDLSKIAFFNAFSRDNEAAKKYFEFIKKRPEPFYQSLHNYTASTELKNLAQELNFKVI